MCTHPCAQNSGVLEAAHKFPPAMANEMLGMGTWRLKGDVNPCIEFLVQRLEGTWREMCPDGKLRATWGEASLLLQQQFVWSYFCAPCLAMDVWIPDHGWMCAPCLAMDEMLNSWKPSERSARLC
eukprot:1157502-Pelagomonas_calceolata.AAC.5